VSFWFLEVSIEKVWYLVGFTASPGLQIYVVGYVSLAQERSGNYSMVRFPWWRELSCCGEMQGQSYLARFPFADDLQLVRSGQTIFPRRTVLVRVTYWCLCYVEVEMEAK
jgi:hypothetical protein